MKKKRHMYLGFTYTSNNFIFNKVASIQDWVSFIETDF